MSTLHIAMLFAGILAAVLIAIKLKAKTVTLVNESRPRPNLADPNSWVIGPVYNNQPNPSIGMPLHPEVGPDGFVIDLKPGREVHYVTANYLSLHGKTKISMKGRIEGGPLFAKDGVSPASLCLYFQRLGDDWQAIDSDPYSDRDTESYRWWATPKALMPLVAGPFELSASFTDKWTAVQYSESIGDPPAGKPKVFQASMDNAGEVGFTFGGGTGWGHGVISPAGAKIIVESFEIS